MNMFKKIVLLLIIIAVSSNPLVLNINALETNNLKLETSINYSKNNEETFDGYVLYSQEFSRYTYILGTSVSEII